MSLRRLLAFSGIFALVTSGCGETAHEQELVSAVPGSAAGSVLELRDTVVNSTFEASGVAEAFEQATLSTRLMGTVREVLVHEGDRVSVGQPLVVLDAAELDAKAAQVAAQIVGAEAMLREAETQAGRIRALFADSAATRAQLDAVETGLIGARSAVEAASAGRDELAAVRSYATVRAPFSGMVTARLVHPGALAAPGAPLVTIQDAARLRVRVSVPPAYAHGVQRGAEMAVFIGGESRMGTVEGVVPSQGGNLATINVIVVNPGSHILSGSAATVAVPTGERGVLLVPSHAVVREGDLTGVQVRTAEGDQLRWVRLGAQHDGWVEVTGGLEAGTRIVVPDTVPEGR
jgi:RND family efflux transporter MFP subunit